MAAIQKRNSGCIILVGKHYIPFSKRKSLAKYNISKKLRYQFLLPKYFAFLRIAKQKIKDKMHAKYLRLNSNIELKLKYLFKHHQNILFTKRECSLIFFALKKSTFLKSMLLLNFPIRWYLNILNLFECFDDVK